LEETASDLAFSVSKSSLETEDLNLETFPRFEFRIYDFEFACGAWRLESAATIEEVSRKMRDTASETLALPF
jgi:hypothetical protein